MDFYDEVYYSLIGQLQPPLGWVTDAFAAGSPCEEAYARLIAARDRLSAKLGQDNDPDLEEMLSQAAAIQRALCRQALALRRP